MDEDLYDEFGNYIGPYIEEDEGEEEAAEAERGAAGEGKDEWMERMEEDRGEEEDAEEEIDRQSTAIILHEDKKYYPEASEVFPEGTETLVEDEDRTTLEQPTIAPLKEKNFHLVEPDGIIETVYERSFLLDLLRLPLRMRNICVCGHLHHGKTSLFDMLVEETHRQSLSFEKQAKYTDTRVDEQDRLISIKATPMTFVLQSLREKSYVFNMIDTPGHVDFSGEVTASMQLCDGVVVVVDALEGVMLQTIRVVQSAVLLGLPIVLVISKIDRLILETKMPPPDMYLLLQHIVEEVNELISYFSSISSASATNASSFDKARASETARGKSAAAPSDSAGAVRNLWPRLSPEKGNVCFACTNFGFSFTVQSFADLYASVHGDAFDANRFATVLWGDVYAKNAENEGDPTRFSRTPPFRAAPRTFVQYILEPLYKIVGTVVAEDAPVTKALFQELGLKVDDGYFRMDARPLLKVALSSFFGSSAGFVSMCVNHLPSPVEHSKVKVDLGYTGPVDSAIVGAMGCCDAEAPLVIQVTKQFERPDCETFDAFGRVYSGTLSVKRETSGGKFVKVVGQKVKVLGETYSPHDEEDMFVQTATNLWIMMGRYRIEIDRAYPGMLVLIEGVEESIARSATICGYEAIKDMHIFRPLRFNSSSWMKVAIEPVNPSDLPKAMEGLRRCSRSYLLLGIKVEESGEHVVIGTGELFLDCVLHDLRRMYTEIEVKVADPVTTFCETVVETSSLKCYADTTNKKNRVTFVAEPLEKGLAEDIEAECVSFSWPVDKLSGVLNKNYGWDLLASRSIWACGPESNGPNVLLDDTLPSEVSKELLGCVREPIVQGFQWAVREGPLCNEPMRNVRFKLLDAQIAADASHRQSAQLVPTARRVAFSAFLMAMPRLMEPILYSEILCPADCVTAVYDILSKRRGHVFQDRPKPGSPLYIVKAYVPGMDSFGYETDLRAHTQGQAFPLSVFDHWETIPGDPLDKSIVVQPLERSSGPSIAREFMVKTRRRKGLGDDVVIQKFFDDPLLLELARQDIA